MNTFGKSMFRLAALAMLACVPGMSAHSQEGEPDGTVTLVATPRLVDPDYRGAVLLAVPVENTRHVGGIIRGPPPPGRPGLQGTRAARGPRRKHPPRRRHHQPPHRTLARQPLPGARPVQ